MKITPVALLLAMLGVTSARVGESVNDNDQEGEMRNLQEEFIEVEVSVPTTMIAPPGGGGDILALGGLFDNIRVMVGYKNNQGKLKAIATEASELINEFKIVNALTMIIPNAVSEMLANDPDIE